MADCWWGGDGLQQQSWGGRRASLCLPLPIPHPTERKGGGVEGGSGHRLVRVRGLLALGVKEKRARKKGGDAGGRLRSDPPSCGVGRRWKSPIASASLNKNSYFSLSSILQESHPHGAR